MPNVCNVYTEGYLRKHEVYDEQFRDRQKALKTAKLLRQQGFTIKVTKICPFGYEIWCVEGTKAK